MKRWIARYSLAMLAIAIVCAPHSRGDDDAVKVETLCDAVVTIGVKQRQLRLVWVAAAQRLPKAGQGADLHASAKPPDDHFEIRLVNGEKQIMLTRLTPMPLSRRAQDRVQGISGALEWDEQTSSIYAVTGTSLGDGVQLALYRWPVKMDEAGGIESSRQSVIPVRHRALPCGQLQEAGAAPQVNSLSVEKEQVLIWLSPRKDKERDFKVKPIVFDLRQPTPPRKPSTDRES